jgi:hypothetical protein
MPLMSNLERDIKSEDYKIEELVKELRQDEFLIPTFQREFVWEPANILKLWDSMYKFYPIGSILSWETASYLHTHRRLGGFVFPHDEDTLRKYEKWQYILDGQQRATALLVSLLGGKGKVEDKEDFDYTLYFDATQAEFFFAGKFDDRARKTSREFLIRVRDVPKWDFKFRKDISAVGGFTPEIEDHLDQLEKMFKDYKIPLIRIKGVEVNEVCDIFERINQEGKRLDQVDIIVARTYRTEDGKTGQPGFYLRDNLKALKGVLADQGNRFQDLDDLTIIQMVALCLRKAYPGPRSPFGITPKALDNLTAEHFEKHWSACEATILETIKFLTDQRIHGPEMLPFGYLILPLCYYFHANKKPDRDLARQWFWRNAFGLQDFRTSTEVIRFCDDFFDPLEKGKEVTIEGLTIAKGSLVSASYNYRNSFSRAVLAFLAKQNPRDFSDPDAEVLDNVYLRLSQAPNLHHIYPLNFLKGMKDLPAGADANSLMNICYLRALTNIRISDKNPLTYFEDFRSVRDFDNILKSHLIPRAYIERDVFEPRDYAEFLHARASLFGECLRSDLPAVGIQITEVPLRF